MQIKKQKPEQEQEISREIANKMEELAKGIGTVLRSARKLEKAVAEAVLWALLVGSAIAHWIAKIT